jgi:hypothetical protein
MLLPFKYSQLKEFECLYTYLFEMCCGCLLIQECSQSSQEYQTIVVHHLQLLCTD